MKLMMIYKREMKKNTKSLVIWSVILAGIILMTLSIYPQFTQDQQTMDDLLSAYPDSFKQAFGMDRLDIGSLLGFYGMQIHFMTTLFGSIFAVMLSSNMIAKEENEKTIEFLLSKPITRFRVVAEKILAVLSNIVILNVVIVIVCLIGFQFADEQVPFKTFSLLILGTFLMHVTFAAIAYFLSAVMKKSRTITSATLGLVLISYFLSVISGITSSLEILKYFSLFEYIDAAEIIANESLHFLYVAIMLAVIALSVWGTFYYYQRKDIAT